ncbi:MULTISPECIES: hypothetical protein [unclassified Variovorax]|uniref:hypothetical protein n=1 Tax=unclassified Variovorax TaxID=663243 RepID=UPI0032E714F6
MKRPCTLTSRAFDALDTESPLMIERSLARRTLEGIEEIADEQLAFEAVERLVSMGSTTDAHHLELDVDRSELGALLRVLNAAMRSSIQKATNAALAANQSLCER